MTGEQVTSAVAPDRVRLPLSFDAAAMEADLQALQLRDFIYYDVIPLTSPRAKAPSADQPAIVDYADGSWADWIDSGFLQDSPYLAQVVDMFRANAEVTLVRLLRLQAGAVVDPHNDPTLALEERDSVVRFTIPISGNEAVEFFLNDEAVPMQPGECWYLRLSDTHSIVHGGSTTRVNLTIDMRPNDWVRSLILG